MKRIRLFFLLLAVSLTALAQHNPYALFEQAMDGHSHVGYGRFTIFCGIDLNVANPRLSGFIENMGLANDDSGFKWDASGMQLKFVPRASSNNDYILIRYKTTERENFPSRYKSEDGLTSVIDMVIIEGSPDIIVRVFVKYWPIDFKIGGYKKGEIAHYVFMGDHISLVGVSPQKYQIKITPGNLKVDYISSYKIE